MRLLGGQTMRRREFIGLIGGAAAWPAAARAQLPALPVIGYVDGWSPEGFDPYLAAFRQGLSETGYVAGKRVTIEYRWAQGEYDRLPTLVADSIQRKVAVIVTGATPVTRAAKAATPTIPIVFVIGRHGRRPDELRIQFFRCISPSRHLCRQDSHRKDAWSHHSALAARPRR